MFTSRAEYRLLLREDNADLRLTPVGRELGLVDDERWQSFTTKREAIEQETSRLASITVHPHWVSKEQNEKFFDGGLSRETKALELLKRPEMTYSRVTSIDGVGKPVADPLVAEQIEIQARYAGYIVRQQSEIARHKKNEQLIIPDSVDYDQVTGLSNEVRQKLKQIQPQTLGQASRIAGMTPAALSLLLVHLKKSA